MAEKGINIIPTNHTVNQEKFVLVLFSHKFAKYQDAKNTSKNKQAKTVNYDICISQVGAVFFYFPLCLKGRNSQANEQTNSMLMLCC